MSELGDEVRELQTTLREIQEKMRKDDLEKKASRESIRNTPSNTALSLAAPAPGPRSPISPGMNLEQLAEFKKIQIVVKSLSDRMKDLENKSAEAQEQISEADERITKLTSNTDHQVKDLHMVIEAGNEHLGEKMAHIRTEVQKLAGDDPKPINYDPFNYGKAYSGDIIDFEARKGIVELKYLLETMNRVVTQVKNSVNVNAKVDLGYQVVRMDDLLASSGVTLPKKASTQPANNLPVLPSLSKVSNAVPSNNASADKQTNRPTDSLSPGTVQHLTRSEALLVTPSTTRSPNKSILPKCEIFQTDDEKVRGEKTDFILQVVYRLELELADLQKTVTALDIYSTQRTLDEIKMSINAIKTNKMDRLGAIALIEDVTKSKMRQLTNVSSSGSSMGSSHHHIVGTGHVTSEKHNFAIYQLTSTIEALMKRVVALESVDKGPHSCAGMKSISTRTPDHQIAKTQHACLSCDTKVAPQNYKPTGNNLPYFQPMSTRQGNETIPPKMQQTRFTGFGIVNRPATPGETFPSQSGRYKRPPKWMGMVDDLPGRFAKQDDGLFSYPPLCPTATAVHAVLGIDGKSYAADPTFNKDKWMGSMQFKPGGPLAALPKPPGHDKLTTKIQVELRGTNDGRSQLGGPTKDKQWDLANPLSAVFDMTSSTAGVTVIGRTDKTSLQPDQLAVIMFSANWCHPCKKIMATVEELSRIYQSAMFYKVDVEEHEPLATRCGVVQLPTFQLYLNSLHQDTVVGAEPGELEEVLRRWHHFTPGQSLGGKQTPGVNLQSTSNVYTTGSTAQHGGETVAFVKSSGTLQKEDAAATKIQAGMKGMMARKYTHELVQQRKQSLERENMAAVKIQAGMKGMMARKQTHQLMEFKREDTAARQIQKRTRGLLTRRRNERENLSDKSGAPISEKSPQLQTSSTKVSAKPSLTKRTSSTTSHKQNEAATKIQAGVKGMIVRKSLRNSIKEDGLPDLNSPDVQKATSFMQKRISKKDNR